MMIDPYYLGILIWILFVMLYFCWLFRNEDGAVNKKVHMKRISFSVDLIKYYSITSFGAVRGYKCLLCQKDADSKKRIITHLNHDHMDKEFLYKVKLDV